MLSANTVAIGTTVMGAGTKYVYGAVSSDAQLSGGEQQVVSGVKWHNRNGGEEIAFSGGAASGTTVFNGGEEIVAYSGFASRTVVSSGGEQIITGRPWAPLFSAAALRLCPAWRALRSCWTAPVKASKPLVGTGWVHEIKHSQTHPRAAPGYQA
jgi:autotransporter passenger strand-loop-strand repeat protein